MGTSPIVLFVYNRPWHTRKTIEALKANALAEDSTLYIYSDSPNNPDEIKKVAEVREYIRTVRGFGKIEIIEREKNQGLARNIISGVKRMEPCSPFLTTTKSAPQSMMVLAPAMRFEVLQSCRTSSSFSTIPLTLDITSMRRSFLVCIHSSM